MTNSDDDVRVLADETLYEGFVQLRRLRIAVGQRDGSRVEQVREIHHHGDGAAMLLHDPSADTVVLVRQFRLPAFLNGDDAQMLEVPAGQLDGDDPAACAVREALEETGYRASDIVACGSHYMSPGVVTERVHLFMGRYRRGERETQGGGLAHEGEDIEVVEMTLDAALAMVASGAIADAKTAMLLWRLERALGR